MKRSIIRCLSLLSFVFLTNSWGHSQLTTDTLISTQDSHTNSRYPTNNYGSITTMKSKTYLKKGVQYYTRSFVQFDLSSIPSNAIVYSASLNVNRTAAVTGGAKWNTKLVTSSWLESKITASVQPTISTFSGDVVSTTPSTSSNLEKIDVTSMVQRMVYGQTVNYGWSIQVEKEVYSGTSGAKFYTKEHATSSLRPKLIVNYYIPLSIATATVTHESATSASDGGVSFTLDGGASTSYTYTWINGATGSQISSSSSSSPVALAGQPYGWYGLHVSGGSYGEDFYQAFLIGTECEEVTITFQPDLNYTDNAHIADLDRSPVGGIDYGDMNYSIYPEIRAIRGIWTYQYEQQHFLEFKLWMDDAFAVSQADLVLKGLLHVTTGGSNAVDLDIVTENWVENVITWNIQPTSSSSTTVGIPSTTYAYQNNTVDLTDFWDVWKADNSLNYGFHFKFQSSVNPDRRHWYHSCLATTVSNRPSIEFKLDLRPTTYLTSSWDVGTDLGSIDIDITCAANTPPYFYFISSDTIIDLDSLYGFYNDTIIGMDSTTFYGMSTTDLQKSFDGLESGHYHVAVFDKFGAQMVNEAVDLMGALTFETQTGLTASGSEVTASVTNSVGSFDCYTYEGHNSSMKIELTGVSGVQCFGFMDMTRTMTSYADIEYGFYLSGTSLYTVTAGVLSGTYLTVSASTVLEVVNEDGTLKLMLDGVQHATKAAPTTFEYKIGLEGQPANKIGFFPTKFVWFGKTKYRFWNDQSDHLTCAGGTGILKFSVGRSGSGEICNIEYTVTGPSGLPSPIQSGTGSTLSSMPLPTINGAALIPGAYVITGNILTCAGGVVPFSETIYFGYEASWATSTDYAFTPNSYSVDRNVSTNNGYAYARSSNILLPDVPGWLEFTVVENSTWSWSFLRLTTESLDLPVTGLIFNEDCLAFRKDNNNVLKLNTYISGSMTSSPEYTIGDNALIRVEYTAGPGGVINIYKNNNFLTSIPRASAPNLARLHSFAINSGFKNVKTSFDCGGKQSLSSVSHAHVKYELDGGFTLALENTLKFVLDGEYSTETNAFLAYNIYDENRLIARSSDASGNVILGSQAVPLKFDDNRYEMDLTGISALMVDTYYVLETIDAKGEKKYLKFLVK